MGTPNYLISAALTLVMAQRLARKNCPDCAVVDETITPKILTDIGMSTAMHDRAKIYKGTGWTNCGNTGYRGRMGIYEILNVTKSPGLIKLGLFSLELSKIFNGVLPMIFHPPGVTIV